MASTVRLGAWRPLNQCIVSYLLADSRHSYDPDEVLRAVQINGPDQWFSICLALGYTSGKANDLTRRIPNIEGKLQNVFDTKAAEVGRIQAAAKLLEACETIPNPIIGIVLEELEGEVVVSLS